MAPPSSHPPGTLYVVATPIGNLEDITIRALRVLEKDVSIIAAEDTRRTAKLLTHYGIPTPTTSFHGHNESRKGPGLLRRLQRGDSVALVSDAGTPLLSDPGARLVRDAIAGGIPVQAVPGASAILAAVVMTGCGGPFTFVGFPPPRSNDRKKWLNSLSTESRPLVVFESPHRIRDMLRDVVSTLGDREVFICREVTKIHEQLVNGPIAEVIELIDKPRGEYTVIIEPASDVLSKADSADRPTSRDIWDQFCHLTNTVGLGRRVAIRMIADSYAMTARGVYAAIESEKNSSVE